MKYAANRLIQFQDVKAAYYRNAWNFSFLAEEFFILYLNLGEIAYLQSAINTIPAIREIIQISGKPEEILMQAIETGFPETVVFLFNDIGLDIDFDQKHIRKFVLNTAISSTNIEMVQFVIREFHMEKNLYDGVIWAVAQDLFEIADHLIYVANAKIDEKKLWQISTNSANLDRLRYIVERIGWKNIYTQTPIENLLFHAIDQNDLSLLQYVMTNCKINIDLENMLPHGTRETFQGHSPLYLLRWAVKTTNLEVLHFVHEIIRLDVSCDGWESRNCVYWGLLVDAIRSEFQELVLFVVERMGIHLDVEEQLEIEVIESTDDEEPECVKRSNINL